MRQWRVSDVMSANVVTAGPDASVSELAQLLTRERISAVPIVADDGRVMGIVSEADLVARLSGAGRRRRKTAAGVPHARQVMSRPVRTAAAAESLSTAARRMRKYKVKRLPVTDETGRAVAVVSRSDLMRVYTRSDNAIRHDVIQHVLRRTLWIDSQQVHVDVSAAVVTLTGKVGRRSTAAMVGRLSGDVPGVQHVVNDIAYDFDDSALVRSRVGRTHPFSAEPFTS
ncbi:CBS domain-containing protein [Paractinoplanes rishiriensis]|uniref:BON domain-containing protein n=1 Tax=Paractinoplanes rishiriensis TaxID=1050105 RepID=A0A919K4P4_9ACTN|nr:CBS domain-containing protein [Actinoplanes rishiriensis]GIF00862.1 hypothetical protein Ari01nite_83260 [Actinoplanes rishiriensis]